MLGFAPRVALLIACCAAPAPAQVANAVEFFGGPLEQLGPGGEFLFLGEQVGKVVSADIELSLTVHEPGDWFFEFTFGLPTGTLVVSSQELEWSGTGTFAHSASTTELNGWIEPFAGHQVFTGYGSWSGGALTPASKEAPAQVGWLNATLDHFSVTLHFAPCDSVQMPLEWKTLDGGIPGAWGEPRLEASYSACLAATGELRLVQGAPFAPVYLAAGGQPVNLPLHGGTLVPSPDLLFGPYFLDQHGTHGWPFAWSSLNLPDQSFWLQAWVVDPSAPAGVSATDGLEAVFAYGG